MYLAINPGHATQMLPGTTTTDLAFGLLAVWIERQRKRPNGGYTVVDSSTVLATHLSHLMQTHAARLLGRAETQAWVEHVSKLAPKLIEDVVPKMVSIPTLQKVLQSLLDEAVNIRDMRTIVETLAESAEQLTDPLELAKRVRVALSPAIVQQIYGPVRELDVIAIEPELERILTQSLTAQSGAMLDPGLAGAAEQARRRGRQAAGGTMACRPACWCPT